MTAYSYYGLESNLRLRGTTVYLWSKHFFWWPGFSDRQKKPGLGNAGQFLGIEPGPEIGFLTQKSSEIQRSGPPVVG